MRLKNKEKQNIKFRLEALIDAYGVDNVAKIFYQILRDMMFDKSCKTCGNSIDMADRHIGCNEGCIGYCQGFFWKPKQLRGEEE